MRQALRAVAVAILALVCTAVLAADGFATGLGRRHGLPPRQPNDVFGVEPGMTLLEVRKALAVRFPTAFAGCERRIESPAQLHCRATQVAYYEEVPGRPLGAQRREGAEYISNLVLTVEEPDAKRSIEVFFGAGASGNEAYRISGITHYKPVAQPSLTGFAAEFGRKFGPMETTEVRGRGTISRAYFRDGQRLNPETNDSLTAACRDLAQGVTSLHDMRAMEIKGWDASLGRPPCDTIISLSLAPGMVPDRLRAVTISVFDVGRLARILDLEARDAAALEARLGAARPRAVPLRGRDF
jgi:hypothetical protein